VSYSDVTDFECCSILIYDSRSKNLTTKTKLGIWSHVESVEIEENRRRGWLVLNVCTVEAFQV
jgi:hypothetical protein